jgi:hypothetical protein
MFLSGRRKTMQLKTTIEINAPISATWDVFGERFADIGEWADAVVKSVIDRPVAQGAVRTCDIKAVGPVPAGQVTEELTEFDREKHKLTYVVTSGSPGFMRHIDNAWTFEALGPKRTRATSVVTFKVAWYMAPMSPVMKMQLGKSLKGFVRELATKVESEVHGAGVTPLAAVG